MSRRERLQRYISTQKLDLYPIPLHLLLLWQAQFLCGDSDYFRVSVTVAQCRARRLGYTDWKGLESITAANISTGMRKIFSHTYIHIWDSVCDEYYLGQCVWLLLFGTVCVMTIMSHLPQMSATVPAYISVMPSHPHHHCSSFSHVLYTVGKKNQLIIVF